MYVGGTQGCCALTGEDDCPLASRRQATIKVRQILFLETGRVIMVFLLYV
jgi:hypothetical protein